MAYATRLMRVPVTYSETMRTNPDGSVRPAGTKSGTWEYWVVAGTLAQQQAAATTCANEQFKNMRIAANGTSIVIGTITEVGSRPGTLPTP